MNLRYCCAFVSLLFGAAASAAPNTGNADVSDLRLNGHAADGVTFSIGNGATGPHGNPSVFNRVFTGSWNLLTKVDSTSLIASGPLAATGLFSSMSFVLDPGGKTGTWSLQPTTNLTIDLVLGIYAGGATTSFLFDNAHLGSAGNSGNFKIDWFDTNGRVPAYSNLTLFYKNAAPPVAVSAVAEPATYAMMLGGLALFSFMARRRSVARSLPAAV